MMPNNIVGTGSRTLTDMNDVVASTTRPSSPIEGTMWLDTTDNKLYIYTSGNWIFSASGIEISGRNLIRNTAFEVMTGWSPTYTVNTADYKGNNSVTLTRTNYVNGNARHQFTQALTNMPLTKTNDEYVLSAWIYVDSSVALGGGSSNNLSVRFNTSGSTFYDLMIIDFTTIAKDTWVYVSATAKLTSDTIGTGSFLLSIAQNGLVKIARIKLETGNIPTEWQKAPEDIETVIVDIQTTLGNMANDSLLDYSERQVVKDDLTDIIGSVMADATTTLPTTATLDSGGKGSFYNARKSATNAGLSTSDTAYVNLATQYNALKTYLEGLTPIDVWDLRTATQNTNVSVVKDTWRTNWLNYYQAEKDLDTATAQKLKDNVDNVTIGGTNWTSNGNFEIDITKSLWSTSYTGQTVEVLDISTEIPPHRNALHVKNTTNANGGIFSPIVWDGTIAGNMLGKEITISFWLKYQNIVQGANSWNLGRFGELIIEGVTGTGSKVYSYPRIQTNNTLSEVSYISGTNMTWAKYYGTYKVALPATAVSIDRIQFKHGIEGATGEFWTTGIKVEIGNKVTDWSQSPLDLQQRIYDVESKTTSTAIVNTVSSSQTYITDIASAKLGATSLKKVRYIRDTINGSTANNGNHWVEIKALAQNGTVNRASGKVPIEQYGVTTNIARITDGDLNTLNYFNATGAKSTYVQIDLGAVYEDIETLQIWHYYNDARSYHGVKTEISVDGTNWTTVFDSVISGEYVETKDGHMIPINLGLMITSTANQLNNTVIGGRNYLLNSGFYRMLNNWYPIDYYIDDAGSIEGELQFDENTDIDIFFQEFFGEDGGDFDELVSTEDIDSIRWVRMRGNNNSQYKGLFQNVKLDSTKSYIISFFAFKGNNTISNLKIYHGSDLLSTINLTPTPTKYIIKFTPTTDNKTQFKLIGDTTSEYDIFASRLHLEEGNLSPTDWTPAPEDYMEDSDRITIVENKVASAEQKISDDSIISTVTNSTSFTTILGGKADGSDVAGLSKDVKDLKDTDYEAITKNAVDSLLNDSDSNLNTTFATKNELIQTSTSLTDEFSASGGMNLLKNSIGYSDFVTKSDADAGIQNWFIGGVVNRASRIQTTALDVLGFGSGFQFTAGATSTNDTSIAQYVNVTPNTTYTLSWYINKSNSSPSGGAFKVYILESDQSGIDLKWSETDATGVVNYTGSQYMYASDTITNGYESQYVTFTPTSNKVRVIVYGYGYSSVVITGLMFTKGDVALQWTLATGEVFNTNVRLDINGVRVSQLDSNKKEIGFTQISPSEFAGYYDSDGDGTFEKIFYLNGDATVSKKVIALNEISLGYIKILRIDSTANTGWAMIPVDSSEVSAIGSTSTTFNDSGDLDGGTF